MRLDQFTFENCLQIGYDDVANVGTGKNQNVAIFRKKTHFKIERVEVEKDVFETKPVQKYLYKLVKTINKIDIYNVTFMTPAKLAKALKTIGNRK